MKINSRISFIIIIVVFFGGIALANNLSLWQTESIKIPKKIKSGDFAGEADPEDIRGSYSFLDIENAFGVKAEIIAKAFMIESENPESVKAKDIEGIFTFLDANKEIGTGSVRLFIALYTGLPYDGEEMLPLSVKEVLIEEGKWNEDIEKKVGTHFIEIEPEKIDNMTEEDRISIEKELLEDNNGELEIENEVKGKTTVNEIINLGISLEQIEEILGVKVPNNNMTVRDICNNNGISFRETKDIMNEKLRNN